MQLGGKGGFNSHYKCVKTLETQIDFYKQRRIQVQINQRNSNGVVVQQASIWLPVDVPTLRTDPFPYLSRNFSLNLG